MMICNRNVWKKTKEIKKTLKIDTRILLLDSILERIA